MLALFRSWPFYFFLAQKGEDPMKRRRRKSQWTDSLPDDGWTNEPKVYLYRLQHPYKPRYLGTYLAELISDVDVMAYWGGGDYFFNVVHRGRVVRRGIWSIEGKPRRGCR